MKTVCLSIPDIIQSVLQTLNGNFWFDNNYKCTEHLSPKLLVSFIFKHWVKIDENDSLPNLDIIQALLQTLNEIFQNTK